jgi:hypothetical protein
MAIPSPLQSGTVAAPPVPLDFRIVALSERMIVMLLWFSDNSLPWQNKP